MARKSRVSYEKNSSGHATRIFAKKSRKFEIPAVGVKRFWKAVLVCRLCVLKTSISLGTWFLYRVFPVRISQASLRYCTVCLPIHRSEVFRKTTGALTTLTISWLLNILGDTSFFRYKMHIILILSFKNYPIFEHLTSFMEQLLMYFWRHKRKETNVVKGHFAT